jgi:hypothetical protein
MLRLLSHLKPYKLFKFTKGFKIDWSKPSKASRDLEKLRKKFKKIKPLS